MASFPRIPINPRLTFGECIEKVCTRGRLHPGLKELFTKAYFSAQQHECLFYDDDTSEENDKSSPGAWILTILKFAQGDVSVRLSLKRRLETGRWLMPLHVPPAAPLWLIRHFLGRLQTPLIFCLTTGTRDLDAFKKRWLLLSKDCHMVIYRHTFNQTIQLHIQAKMAEAIEELKLEACLTLISLITLIRNLSYEPSRGWIDKHAVKALVDYFVPALISRPYRPGYKTKEDKESESALCYLCHNLPEIQPLFKRPATRNNVHLIFDSSSHASILEPFKKRENTPTMKKVISEEMKPPICTTDGPDSGDVQPTPSVTVPLHPSKCLRTPTKSSEPKRECREIMSVLMETSDGKESKGITEDKLFKGNSEERDVETKIKSMESNNSEDSHTMLPFKEEGQAKSDAIDVMKHTIGNEQNVTDCIADSPEKKSQAIKLAFKLRGQWLAWRLAGLFLDGATSNLSGFAYTKLPHDTSCLVNQ